MNPRGPVIYWGLVVVLIVEAVAAMWVRAPWRVVDSMDYIRMAAGDPLIGQLRAPGYPLFLALFQALGLNWAAIVAVQMVLYISSIILLDRYLFRTKSPIFMFLCAIYVFPMLYAASIASEALTIFCIALGLALAFNSRSLFGYAFSGVAMGYAVLTRPDVILIVLVLPVLPFFLPRTTGRLKGALIIFAGSAMMLGPYTVWNGNTFGSFSPLPVSSMLGQSLYMATWESRASFEDMQTIAARSPATTSSIKLGIAEELKQITSAGNRSSDFLTVALRRIVADPSDAVLHSVKATWRLFNTGRYPAPPSITAVLMLVSGAIWLLGLAGMVRFARGALLVPAAILFAVLLPHLPLHTEARYTAPIRLILVFFAALALSRLLYKWRAFSHAAPSKSSKESPYCDQRRKWADKRFF